MKRIFTLTVLITAFVMNVAAWEPVIKEKHWFGMHEYYGAPIIGVNSTSMNSYILNSGFGDIKTEKRTINSNEVTIDVLNGWTETGSYFSGSGMGKIGTCTININKWQGTTNNVNPSVIDDWHSGNDYCIGLEARWANSAISFSQELSLPAGDYTLKFDVQNVNPSTTSSTTTDYDDLFYVKVGSTEFRENYSNNQATWMTYNNGDWSTHTISFSTDGTNPVKISLGYGVKTAIADPNTPQLYVSHLQLDVVGNNSEGISRITWNTNTQDGLDYLESITVVRDWTGKTPPQQPKTLYYSWIDHKLRFSVENKASWGLAKGDGGEQYDWNGLGLCNTSDDYNFFYIHDLKEGDQISIEYYVDKQNLPMHNDQPGYNFVYDVDGLTEAGGLSGCYKGTNIESKNEYTVSAGGIIRFNVGKKIIIRSVTIIHASANYKKATYRIDEVRDGNDIGYKYTLTNSGVLEDKRGAVPYITMRFGGENDMTFVRKLGDGNNAEYAASSIIDGSDVFNPTAAKFQEYYQSLTVDQAKDRLANKEWTVFSTDLDSNGKDIFSSILPEYGTYYYFFPEVNGKLSVRFYCEGAQEHMPFWFKSKDGQAVDLLKAGQDTDGSNYYEYNDIEVEKGAVYYLCANPTIIQHEHPIVRLISYTFIPTFRVAPLYKVVSNTEVANGSTEIEKVAEIYNGPYKGFVDGDNNNGATTGDIVSTADKRLEINKDSVYRVQCLGNVASAKAYITVDGTHQYLNFKDVTFKSGNANHGGAIVAILDCAAGRASFVLTIAYDAAEATMEEGIRTGTTTEVKKWDFFSGIGEKGADGWDIGKYGTDDGRRYNNAEERNSENNAAWLAKSKLFKETHKADGLTADWQKTFVTLKENGAGEEPIFKSVYDMEGDNADMIHETAGLIFLTESNLLGIYNENGTSSGSFNDRYIGLMGPKEMPLEHGDHEHQRALIIPRLKAGDRIVIKMGCYGNIPNDGIQTRTATLKITGATDAIGDAIDGDYIIGGSGSESGNFHTGATTDLSKPYGEYHFIATGPIDIIEDNATINTQGDFTLEVKEADLLKLYSIEIYRNTDILTENSINMTGISGHEILNTGSASSMNINLPYSGLGETSENLISRVSSHRTGSYMSAAPSFTNSGDIYTYTPAENQFGLFRARLGVKTTDNAYVTDYADYDMAVGYLEKKDYPYTWDFTDLKKYAKTGGDLTTSTGDEILASGVDTNLSIWDNYGLNVKTTGANPETTFVSGGQLYAGDGMFAESKGIGIVPTNSATANVINLGTSDENGGMIISNADLTIPQVAAGNAIYVRAHKDNENAATPTYNSSQAFVSRTTTDGSGDEIFAMQMADNAATADVTLHFNGYTVRKVAVSDAPKKVNKYGWTSESREHVIDPELTSYMTGVNFSTYLVTDVDYDNYKVTLTAIDNDHLMPAANADGSENACLIHNHAGEEVKILNDGFHLFVPDMHKALPAATSSSKLKAQLTAGTVAETTGDYTNFAFTYLYYDTTDGSIPDDAELEDGGQAFYHIASGGATSLGHQGYLPLLTSELPADVVNGGRGFALSFGNGDMTAVETTRNVAPKTDVYYNLSGQQLDGKPSQRGLYIVNGKKMYVK